MNVRRLATAVALAAGLSLALVAPASADTAQGRHAATSARPSKPKPHQAGQFCKASDAGKTSVSKSGVKLVCKKNKGRYRWTKA